MQVTRGTAYAIVGSPGTPECVFQCEHWTALFRGRLPAMSGIKDLTLSRLPTNVRLVIVALIALLWVFWPTLTELAGRWGSQSQYSHGYLVPAFSIYLLWARRHLLPAEFQANAWGLLVLVVGLALRFAGTYLYFEWLGATSLLICLVGVCVLVGGKKALLWAWPAIGFLIFMVPMPYRVEMALAHPLQRLATAASTYALQTLGFPAYADGLVIRIYDIRIGIVEACSGLSMLQIFFALSTAVTLLSQRSFVEKSLIFLSAIPIALAANIIRIIVTAIMHLTVGSEWADYVFHDLAGWLMMPLALAMLWAIVKLLDWILVTPPPVTESDVCQPWSAWGAPGGQTSQPTANAAQPTASNAAPP
jgi:exosortase